MEILLAYKQVKLWFYKLPPAGLAAVRKIQNGNISEKINLKPLKILKLGHNCPRILTQPCSSMVKLDKFFQKSHKTLLQWRGKNPREIVRKIKEN